MIYQLGQAITWALSVRDDGNRPASVPDLTATVTKPDGTLVDCPPAMLDLGEYQTSLPVADVLGRYAVRWTGSGVNSGGLPYTDLADVLDLTRMIVPLATARDALNLPAAATVDDEELRLTIAAATVIIEHIAGPVLPATVVERRSGGGLMSLSLYQRADSITSVVEDGTTLTASDYALDEHAILWRGSRRGAGAWSDRGVANVVVTYTVGAPVVGPDIIHTARELVIHLRRSQTATRPVMGSTSPESTMVAGYLVPNRVVEGLAAHKAATTLPGIA